jgi:hypothetical protein
MPQDREGRLSTEPFERDQRSERAPVAAPAEMHVRGVSTRKVQAVTAELCGHRFSASSISAINQRLDASLARSAGRHLAEACPYLIPNDHDVLRHHPALAVLAGKSTLSRLELGRPAPSRYHKIGHDPAAIENSVRNPG